MLIRWLGEPGSEGSFIIIFSVWKAMVGSAIVSLPWASVVRDLTHGYNFSGKNKCNHWHLHKTYTSGEEKNGKNGMCLEFNVQNLFSWQWLCLDLDKDWCLRKVELKIARTHIEQITAKAVIHSGGNVMMTWAQQNFKQITMCLKPFWSIAGPPKQARWARRARPVIYLYP